MLVMLLLIATVSGDFGISESAVLWRSEAGWRGCSDEWAATGRPGVRCTDAKVGLLAEGTHVMILGACGKQMRTVLVQGGHLKGKKGCLLRESLK